MADGQQEGSQGTQGATGNAGGGAGQGQQTGNEKKTYTLEEHQAELQKEADRRVTEAQKKWRADQEALLADKSKDAETRLKELQTKAEEAEAYAGFVEAAHAAGVRNAKAAYIVAKHGGYIDARGRFNLESFKKDNPEFFAPIQTANANAGNGAGAATSAGGMNAWIRSAAGR